MSDTRRGEWLVMDGRSVHSTDDASVMEALGSGRRDNIPRKAASKEWSGYDAHLCFCPRIDAKTCGPAEYVEAVK